MNKYSAIALDRGKPKKSYRAEKNRNTKPKLNAELLQYSHEQTLRRQKEAGKTKPYEFHMAMGHGN